MGTKDGVEGKGENGSREGGKVVQRREREGTKRDGKEGEGRYATYRLA